MAFLGLSLNKVFIVLITRSMHFEHFAQLFTVLTFFRNFSYSAGLVFLTTELQLRVRSYELRSEPRSTTQLLMPCLSSHKKSY